MKWSEKLPITVVSPKPQTRWGFPGQPSVNKSNPLVEARLLLFHRTTRTVSLTEAGRQLVDALNRGDDEISGLLDLLSEGQEKPSGKLKINAPMAFGERFLVGPIAEFARLYPEVIVDVEFNDKRVHLVEEGFDLVIRIGTLEDSGLSKRLCGFPAKICASPDFIKRFGMPNRPLICGICLFSTQMQPRTC